MSSERKVHLGNITGIFGLRGWIKVFSETEPRENIVEYQHWWVRPANRPQDGWRQLKVLEGRRQGKTVIARVADIESPEAAELLIGHEIAVDRDQMPSLGRGEFYWTDLIGLAVVDQNGDSLGTVERLFATGANDVVVVRQDSDRKSDDRDILIPWIMGSVILDVDTELNRITVDWDADY